MKSLEKGQEKIEKICDILKKETIEPAQKEALKIIEEAKKQAGQIIAEAESQGSAILEKTKNDIEQERNVFHSSLLQAAKQSLESLRQDIENNLFNTQLELLIESETKDPKVIASLINAIVKAIEKEGISTDIEAIIPENVSPREINELLLEGVVKHLKKHPVTVGKFKGGAQVKIVDKKMKIDMSEKSLMELLSSFVRKDFRKLIFNA